HQGIGLVGMRDRAELAGGTLLVFHRLRVSKLARFLPPAQHARAYHPGRYLNVAHPAKIPCRDPRLPTLCNRLQISAAPTLLALPRGALHYSAPLATHDTPALRQYHPADTRPPIFRNVPSARSDALPSGCTNPGCSRVLVHPAARDAVLATSFE